jgi:hypothetical protein
MQNFPKKFHILQYANLFHYKAFQKFTQIGIFGLKTYHLASLADSRPSFRLCEVTIEAKLLNRPEHFRVVDQNLDQKFNEKFEKYFGT